MSFSGASRVTTLTFITSSSCFDPASFSYIYTWCSHDFHCPSNLVGSSPMPSCNTACNISSRRPAALGALSATNCLQAPSLFLSGTRCTSIKLRLLDNVANKAYRVWFFFDVLQVGSSLFTALSATQGVLVAGRWPTPGARDRSLIHTGLEFLLAACGDKVRMVTDDSSLTVGVFAVVRR